MKLFLRFALLGLGLDVRQMFSPYDSRLELISLLSLLKRRIWIGNGEVNFTVLLIELNIRTPSRCTRHYVLIKLLQCRTNYGLFHLLTIIGSNCNEYYHFYDSATKIISRLPILDKVDPECVPSI